MPTTFPSTVEGTIRTVLTLETQCRLCKGPRSVEEVEVQEWTCLDKEKMESLGKELV